MVPPRPRELSDGISAVRIQSGRCAATCFWEKASESRPSALAKPVSGYSTLARLVRVRVRPSTWTATLASGLTGHVRRVDVVAQALVDRGAHTAGPGPHVESELGY